MNKKLSQLTKSPRYFIITIIILVSTLYFQTLSYELIFLDDETIIHNKFEGLNLFESVTFSFTSNYLGGHYYRPVLLITLVADSIIAGKSYLIYHLNNFLIHLLTCILIFLCFKKLGYSLIISGITALLFALSPIQINAVGWIVGRGDLLAGFFSVLAILIFLKFLKKNQPLFLILVSLLLFFAVLSKEVAVLVPFLFIVLYFIEKKELSLDKNSIGVLMMIVLVFGSYYILGGIFLSDVHLDKFSFTAVYKNIFVLPETISKFFIPIGIKALPRFERFTSISGIIIFLSLLLLPFKFKSINHLRYYFGLSWFVILLIPGMVTRTMEQDGSFYWDCRSYLPLIGLLLLLAELINTIDLQNYKKQLLTLTAIYFLILGTYTFIKIRMYENPITYWNSVKADYPNHFLPYVGLYNYYNKSKDLKNAEAQLVKAIEINHKDLSLRLILNNFYLVNNKSQKAFQLLKDTFGKKINGSASQVETYIALCIGLDELNEIDNLIAQYSEDNNIKERIKEFIIQKAASLKENKDDLKSNLLLEKIRKFNL